MRNTLLYPNAVAFKGYLFLPKNITASAKLCPGWITSTTFSKPSEDKNEVLNIKKPCRRMRYLLILL
jgi:hypothetical protein